MTDYAHQVVLHWRDIQSALRKAAAEATGAYHATLSGNSPAIRFARLDDAIALAGAYPAARVIDVGG